MLTVQGLATSYGGIEALRGVDLVIPEGVVAALVGANGAGKTTLINSITGVVRSHAGSVRFEGEEILGRASYEIARRGLIQVPEGRRVLAPLTVRENLELGWQSLGRRGKPGRGDIDRVYELFPRLREREKQLGGSLSGGEQQMLAIGRALMARPRLLLLDEPSLGLSPLMVRMVFEAIRQLASSGLTMLLVEQNARLALDTASYAFVIERGTINRHGRAREVRDDPAVVEAYLGTGSRERVQLQPD